MGYTYPASGGGSARPHAVRRVNGSGGSAKTVTIRAKGVYSGGWPQMKLYVNGGERCVWTVNSSSYTNYSCNTALSGNDVVEVVYTNDVGSRALYVDYVVVDWGSGAAAFDGLNVVVGQELLDQSGALRLVKGGQAMALGYDANGNMTSRVREGEGQILTYDVENRLVKVEKSGATPAEFFYDGDGKRVKGLVGGVTTVYIGDYFEWTGSTSTMKKYYYAGAVRVAMRVGASTRYFLLTDHLGSTALVTDSSGARVAEVRYKAWGEDRYTFGTTPTTFRYTGQRWEVGLGLYFYNARWYDPALSRFVQADTVVPGSENPQAFNRYSYCLNSPSAYRDPSGHCPLCVAFTAVAYLAIVGSVTYWDLQDGRFDAPAYFQTSIVSFSEAYTGFGNNPLASLRAKDFPESPEMTSWLLQTMQANAAGAGKILAAYNSGGLLDQIAATTAWTDLVKSGGPWDYKKELTERGMRTVNLAGSEWDYQIVANIHFGYVGRAAGFSGDFLLFGAGVAQIGSGSKLPWITTCFDDPADRAAILVGIYLYEKYGRYGIPLTEEMLWEALALYKQDLVWEENPDE